MKLKKGDHVIVLTGKHRGETADVLTVLPSQERRHPRQPEHRQAPHARRQARARTVSVQQAGIIDKFMPMDASDVALWCAKHGGPARAGYREDNGKKVRFCRKCGEKL